MTTFRLDRGAAMAAAGVGVLASGVLVLIAFGFGWPLAGWLAGIVAVCSVWMALRPPVVVRLDSEGYRSRVRLSSGPFTGTWTDVTDADLRDGALILRTSQGDRAFPLRLVGDRRVQFLTAVSSALDAANGYRRWLG